MVRGITITMKITREEILEILDSKKYYEDRPLNEFRDEEELSLGQILNSENIEIIINSILELINNKDLTRLSG